MAKKKKRRWFMLNEVNGYHWLRDAKTAMTFLHDATKAEVDAYLAKVEQADGLRPEITHMGEYRR
jgi:hypothetical protein